MNIHTLDSAKLQAFILPKYRDLFSVLAVLGLHKPRSLVRHSSYHQDLPQGKGTETHSFPSFACVESNSRHWKGTFPLKDVSLTCKISPIPMWYLLVQLV